MSVHVNRYDKNVERMRRLCDPARSSDGGTIFVKEATCLPCLRASLAERDSGVDWNDRKTLATSKEFAKESARRSNIVRDRIVELKVKGEAG